MTVSDVSRIVYQDPKATQQIMWQWLQNPTGKSNAAFTFPLENLLECDRKPREPIKTQRKPKKKRQQKRALHITCQVFNAVSNMYLVGSHLQFPFPCLRVLHQQLIHHTKHLFHDSILAQIVSALNRWHPQSLAVVSSSNVRSPTQYLMPVRIKGSLRVTQIWHDMSRRVTSR